MTKAVADHLPKLIELADRKRKPVHTITIDDISVLKQRRIVAYAGGQTQPVTK